MISLGGKKRLGPKIVRDIYDNVDGLPCDYVWWEPFVGGGNVIENVTGYAVGSDANPDIIKALIAIRDKPHLLPKNNKEYTEEDYRNRKPSPLAPFAYSVGGKMWGGWRRGDSRDYVAEAYRSAQKQSEKLRYKQFYDCAYHELDLGSCEMIIYCDPPYEGTTKYKFSIDREHFWNWCREKSSEGHEVFVSEYKAPDDFELISEYKHNALSSRYGSRKSIERLFKAP